MNYTPPAEFIPSENAFALFIRLKIHKRNEHTGFDALIPLEF